MAKKERRAVIRVDGEKPYLLTKAMSANHNGKDIDIGWSKERKKHKKCSG
jgi:hypothetical protein